MAQSLAQQHAKSGFFESLLVGLGPAILSVLGLLVVVLTWLNSEAAKCPATPVTAATTLGTSTFSPICSVPGAAAWIVFLFPIMQLVLPAAIRAVQAWLIVKHAPQITVNNADGTPVTAGSPVVQSVESIIVNRSAIIGKNGAFATVVPAPPTAAPIAEKAAATL